MQSKKSFFNKTLFRKNLTRYWPLWGGLTIAGAFIPLFLVVQIVSHMSYGLQIDSEDLVEILYMCVTNLGPAFLMGYAIVCAMLVWNYLYSPRAIGLMHTLPVSRTCLFFTNVLSGLTIMAIPFTVLGGLLSIISLVYGFFPLVAVAKTVAAVVCMAVLFFSIATLCAMLTGHNAVLPVLYLLVNFLAEIVEVLVSYLASSFLMGLPMQRIGRLLFLTPVLEMYKKFYSYRGEVYLADGSVSNSYQLQGLGTVALYGLAGVVLLALSWMLYLSRQSERAGDVVAYRPLRPVFRYGVALLSALTLGQLLYELMWESIFYSSVKAELIPMILSMTVAGVFGYYIASMILEKSLRVFRGSWKGILVVFAGIVVLCGAVHMDLLGLEKKIPELDDIANLSIQGPFNSLYLDPAIETDRGLTEQVLALHQAILSDKEYIYRESKDFYYNDEDDGNRSTIAGLYICYTLKDGSSLDRHYTLPCFESRMQDTDTYDGKLYQLTHSEEARLQQVQVPDGSLLRIDVYALGIEVEGVESSAKQIYAALLQDAREGNISSMNGFPYWEAHEQMLAYSNADIWLEILYTAGGGTIIESKGVDLNWGMTHTIGALVAEGYFTQKQMDAMQSGTYGDYEEILG